MPTVEHIDLKYRKCISGRVAFIKASLPHERVFDTDQNTQNAFNQVRTTVDQLTSSETYDPANNKETMSDFVDRLLKEAKQTKMKYEDIKKITLTTFDTFFKDFESNVNEIDCKNCFIENICNGEETDEQNVASDGLCFKYFKDFFDIALQTSTQFYIDNSSNFPEVPPLTSFNTKFTEGKPNNLSIDMFVNATTNYKVHSDKKNNSSNEIDLIFQVKKFSETCLLSIPYILFHECIAHIFRAIIPSGTPREHTGAQDPFDEGWMDYCALEVLKKHLESGTSLPDMPVALKDKYIEAGINLHKDRFRNNQEEYSATARHIRSGVEAAKRTHKYFNNILNCEDRSFGAFLRLSFDLNMHGFTKIQHMFFVAQCNKLLPDDWGRCNPPEQLKNDIYRIFTAFLNNGNATEFYKQLLKV